MALRTNVFRILLAILTVIVYGCANLRADTAKPMTIDVKECGAKGDGKTIDTAALQAAIDRAAKAGGGVATLSAGRFVTGSLLLKSHVTLRITPDAALVGSTAFADYRDLTTAGQPLPASNYAQDETKFRGLLIALDADAEIWNHL